MALLSVVPGINKSRMVNLRSGVATTPGTRCSTTNAPAEPAASAVALVMVALTINFADLFARGSCAYDLNCSVSISCSAMDFSVVAPAPRRANFCSTSSKRVFVSFNAVKASSTRPFKSSRPFSPFSILPFSSSPRPFT